MRLVKFQFFFSAEVAKFSVVVNSKMYRAAILKMMTFIGGACVAKYLRFFGAILVFVVSNYTNVSCCGFFLSSLKL